MTITYTRTVHEDSRTFETVAGAIEAATWDLEELLAEHWEHEDRPGNDDAREATREALATLTTGTTPEELESTGSWSWTYPAPQGAAAVTFSLVRD